MSETGDLLDKSGHEIARLRQQVAELEALKIAHLVGNPLKEIEALRQVNLISQQTIDDKNVQIAELTAKLDKAREALEFYADRKNWHKDSQQFGSFEVSDFSIIYNDFYEQNQATRYAGNIAKQALEELDK